MFSEIEVMTFLIAVSAAMTMAIFHAVHKIGRQLEASHRTHANHAAQTRIYLKNILRHVRNVDDTLDEEAKEFFAFEAETELRCVGLEPKEADELCSQRALSWEDHVEWKRKDGH